LVVPRVPGNRGRNTITNELSEIKDINTPSFMDDIQPADTKFSVIPDSENKSEHAEGERDYNDVVKGTI
jgi:hypothetical protein